MTRRVVGVGLAVVTLVAVGVLGLIWQPWNATVPDGAAFVVGDEVVTVPELDERNESLRALYGIQTPLDDDELAEFERQAAKSMAISMVLERALDDSSVEVSDDEIEAALDTFLEARFGGDRQAFVGALGDVGTSERLVREEVGRQLRLRALLQEVVGPVEVSSVDLRAAFEERRADLGTPERRSVQNLVIAGRAEAARVRALLEAGGDIRLLARRYSIDESTRDRGGDLGRVTRQEMIPAVGEAVFAVRAGGVYGPVRASQGWNVGVVTEVFAPVPARLESVRGELQAVLETERTYEHWSAWLEERLREADIEYSAAYRPTDPYEITSWSELSPAAAPEGLRQ